MPLLLVFFLIAYIFLIKHHGISPTPAQAEDTEASGGRLLPGKETGSYPTHLRKMVGYGVVLLALAGILSMLFPQPVGPAPDSTMEVTKPLPIYYWLYSFEDWFGLLGILYGAIECRMPADLKPATYQIKATGKDSATTQITASGASAGGSGADSGAGGQGSGDRAASLGPEHRACGTLQGGRSAGSILRQQANPQGSTR